MIKIKAPVYFFFLLGALISWFTVIFIFTNSLNNRGKRKEKLIEIIYIKI